MGKLEDDLDKFLKTDGVRIVIDSEGAKAEPYEPLTVEDINDFAAMDLDGLDKDDLEDLMDKAEELQDTLEDDEPDDEDSEEYDLWEARLTETEIFIDRIQDRLDELESEENEDAETAAGKNTRKDKT